MKTIRIIPRLDIKGPNVIKGVHLDCLRVVGDPQKLATKYYQEGADELIYMDIVASLYQRNNLLNIISRAAK
ncbi:MAG: HisA/HisF-related TIM barrel protein, partial [Nanoarchaeota archaeon]|nr:HisA/HisF-related TIM barrel protein [Nanoarchaeota archaeon]